LLPHEIGAVARKLVTKENCEVVVVSMGASGAMLVTKSTALTIAAPAVRKSSTVGAGDSMVAGIVLSLFNEATLEMALAYGVACGTAATLNPGTELCRKVDADNLFKLIVKMNNIRTSASQLPV
jgi:6-phosphofructokinase 2